MMSDDGHEPSQSVYVVIVGENYENEVDGVYKDKADAEAAASEYNEKFKRTPYGAIVEEWPLQ